jgi:hypothetical protein
MFNKIGDNGELNLIVTNQNGKPSDWDDCGFSSNDKSKRAQLQVTIRTQKVLLYTFSYVYIVSHSAPDE